jgi:hypothetical protein
MDILPPGPRSDELGPPVVGLSVGIEVGRLADQGERPGERLVVIVEPR